MDSADGVQFLDQAVYISLYTSAWQGMNLSLISFPSNGYLLIINVLVIYVKKSQPNFIYHKLTNTFIIAHDGQMIFVLKKSGKDSRPDVYLNFSWSKS